MRKKKGAVVLDHIAVAVESLEVGKKVFEDIGFVFSSEEERVEDQKVITKFVKVDENAKVELLEGLGNGPIDKYIEKNGPGIHHLCFSVDDLKIKCEELLEKGYKLIYPSPVKGAHGKLVNFIHPKSTNGILIELAEG